jgi:hypothetical protein
VDPLLIEDLVRLGGGGAVGELRDDLRLNPGGVLLGDDVLEGGDDQDVDVELQELLVGDLDRRLPRGIDDGAGLFLDAAGEFQV